VSRNSRHRPSPDQHERDAVLPADLLTIRSRIDDPTAGQPFRRLAAAAVLPPDLPKDSH
jgi:hypothetical protein